MLIPLLASVLSTVPSPDRSSSSHAARAPCLLQNYGTSLPLEVASSEGFFPEVGERVCSDRTGIHGHFIHPITHTCNSEVIILLSTETSTQYSLKIDKQMKAVLIIMDKNT